MKRSISNDFQERAFAFGYTIPPSPTHIHTYREHFLIREWRRKSLHAQCFKLLISPVEFIYVRRNEINRIDEENCKRKKYERKTFLYRFSEESVNILYCIFDIIKK